jgi:hypothetical protein
MKPAVAALLSAAVVVIAGCGNFFPNPDNEVLPSAARSYDLVCGTVPRAECEARAAKLVAEKQRAQPGNRIVTVRIDARGGYSIVYADGSGESMIVD